MAASGLDPAAETRPSLYQAAHSGNITALAETGLAVRQAVHETHRFTFPALADAAEYLATSPKYDLPPALAGSADALAATLAARLPDQPVTATSDVTYCWATPRIPMKSGGSGIEDADAGMQGIPVAVFSSAAAPCRCGCGWSG